MILLPYRQDKRRLLLTSIFDLHNLFIFLVSITCNSRSIFSVSFCSLQVPGILGLVMLLLIFLGHNTYVLTLRKILLKNVKIFFLSLVNRPQDDWSWSISRAGSLGSTISLATCKPWCKLWLCQCYYISKYSIVVLIDIWCTYLLIILFY